MIEIASPTGSGLPGQHAVRALKGAASVPVTGIPVLVLHGPFAVRAALAMTPEQLLVRPLAPLVPSTRIRRGEVSGIEVIGGHWYAFGRRTICVQRTRGPGVRLMAPNVPGIPDGTENLGRLLRAWWRSGPQ